MREKERNKLVGKRGKRGKVEEREGVKIERIRFPGKEEKKRKGKFEERFIIENGEAENPFVKIKQLANIFFKCSAKFKK